jgi:hypothetical protein
MGNRATLRIGGGDAGQIMISPRNDRQLLYSVQNGPHGEALTRVDYCLPIQLERGMIDFQIEYKGAEVKVRNDTAGLRLSWSGEDFVMEPVPASAFFHEAK